jgi:hypothetical protein
LSALATCWDDFIVMVEKATGYERR